MKCLGENTETYKTFSVEYEKDNNDNNEKDNNDNNDENNKKKKPISYKLKFIDSYRFINRPLDTFVNNFFLK